MRYKTGAFAYLTYKQQFTSGVFRLMFADVLRVHISHGSCAAGGEYQLALVNGLATVPTAMPKG